MFGIVGLEGKNSNYSELNWKTVTKGKRSRKPVTRSGRCKLASEGPRKEREYSVSDVERFDEPLTGQLLADGLGCVPFKKRRYVLHSPPPSRNNEPLSPQQQTGSHSEDFEHLSDKNVFSGDQSSDSYSNTQRLASGDVNISDDGNVDDKVSGDTNNLSGIPLLADAACFSGLHDNPGAVKGEVAEVSSTLRKCDDTCASTTPLGESVPCSESESSSHKGALRLRHENCSSTGEDYSAHTEDKNRQVVVSTSISSKVDRCHWDLNTVMEAWEERQDDLVVRNNSAIEESTDGIQKEKLDVKKEFPTQLDSPDKGNDVNISLGSVDIVSAITVSKVLNRHEVPICKVKNNAKLGGSTLKDSEQEVALPEVAGLDMSRSENNSDNAKLGGSTLKDSEQEVALPEVAGLDMSRSENNFDAEDSLRTTLGKSCKTVGVEFFLISNEGQCPPLCKVEDMSSSDIYVGQSAVCGDRNLHQEKAFLDKDHGDEDHSFKHDTHLDSSVGTVNASVVQDSMKPSANDHCLEADVSQVDDQGRLDAAENVSEILLHYDSPYEDGELRLPAMPFWDRDEMDDGEDECVDYESDGRVGEESDVGDHPGMEIVKAASEGSDATGKLDLLPTEVSKGVNRMSTSGLKKGNDEKAKIETEVKKVSNQGSGTTEELSTPMVQKHDVSMTRRCSFDNTDNIHTRGLRTFKDRKEDVQFPQNMARKIGDSVSRCEKGSGADSSVTRFRSTPYERRQVSGYGRWNYRDSSQPDLFRGPEGEQQNRPRNTVADFADKFDGLNSYENNEPLNISKTNQRPFLRRRSPIERDDYFSDHRNITSRYRRGSSGNFAGRIGRGTRKEYDEPVIDDAASSGRFTRYLPRRERSFSPSDKVPHWYAPRRKSRSRSRTGSPRVWQSQRERNLNNRRYSRSPEFRSESNVERTRLPFQKPNSAADYGESFVSTPKGPFPAKHNNRWVNERNFENRLRQREYPLEVFNRSQRVDAVDFDGRISRGHRKEYDEPEVDDDASSGRLVRYLPRRQERSFSPSDKVPHVYVPSRKSRSRSRTSSPRVWQSQRERNLNNRRRYSRSPELRTESSVERTRLSFPKANCLADYGESFISIPKGPFSAKHNSRWVNERNFANRFRHRGSDGDKLGESCDDREHDERLGFVHPSVRRPLHDAHVNFEDDNYYDKDDRDNDPRSISSFADERNFGSSPSRRRRTPPGMFRRTKRFESDDYFKSVTRPGRFTAKTGVHWGNDLDEKTDDRMQEERSGTIRSVGLCDSNSHLRGSRHETQGNFRVGWPQQ